MPVFFCSVAEIALLAGLDLSFVRNPEWERENGVSVACAAGSVGDRFVLLMSDHLFEERVLARLLAEPIAGDEVILAVDTRIIDHPTVDLEDVTRVRVESGAIRGGLRPKVEACLRAVRGGVRRTHVIDGRTQDSLLVELFTGHGSDTMIVATPQMQAYREQEL